MLTNLLHRTTVLALCALTVSPYASLPALAKEDSSPAPTSELPQEAKFATVYEEAKAKLPEDLYILYRIVERMARANNLDEYPWRVSIGEADEMDAYATEENLMVISFGLLDRMAGDVSALACVVGHEMAHHINKHSAVFTARASEWREGLDSDNQEDVQKYEEQSAELRRAQELEADAWGYRYATSAGFDASGCERGFNLLSRLPDSLRDSDSHPAVPKRLEALKTLMAGEPPQTLATKGESFLKATTPLSYEMIDQEGRKWLRINSERGGSFQQDWERLFPEDASKK
ncbi:M48 family metallopeptidase [Oscillatoria sp. FACHB-1406]|uniref:M48 family metalloprotease n=1 Tax=Oscillatoria sp. FACHB-1406 TaxID=2692846 RepID=UPI0016873EA6|nr:M48 family metalloprotease [Oscillatoria sp. FACHB-1406]